MGGFLCFNGDPVEEDPRKHLVGRQWETSMCHSCSDNLGGFCLAMFCPPCMAYSLRTRALQGDMTKYKCCQGLICGQCMSTCDDSAQSCPAFCLCLEVFCFPNCAISATRIFVQIERQIQTDPCDNRIIRFNNLMQILSCICHVLAIFIRDLRLLARIIDLLADIVYCITQACMQAQVDHELTLHPSAADYATVVKQPVMVAPPSYNTQAPAGTNRQGYAPLNNPQQQAPPPGYPGYQQQGYQQQQPPK